MVINKMDVT